MLEFIDMEHTPKNILLRAVKKGTSGEKVTEDIIKCEQFLQAELTLGRLLNNKGE